ncbi:MAG: hypothetical protein C0397_05775 [Odoribacter sp.]|nr:hypothetical protein [Odoribacter sp.]
MFAIPRAFPRLEFPAERQEVGKGAFSISSETRESLFSTFARGRFFYSSIFPGLKPGATIFPPLRGFDFHSVLISKHKSSHFDIPKRAPRNA